MANELHEIVEMLENGSAHVIFQDLDWVPANHLQAEDRAYRMGQTERVTVEYMLADDTLDVFIADLLETKLRLIGAVESEEVPNASVLDELYAKLRSLGPALLQATIVSKAHARRQTRRPNSVMAAIGISRPSSAAVISSGPSSV